MSEAPSSKRPGTKDIQDAMRRAIKEELERKRKLGHYYVIWQNNKIIIQGEDAPSETRQS